MIPRNPPAGPIRERVQRPRRLVQADKRRPPMGTSGKAETLFDANPGGKGESVRPGA